MIDLNKAIWLIALQRYVYAEFVTIDKRRIGFKATEHLISIKITIINGLDND